MHAAVLCGPARHEQFPRSRSRPRRGCSCEFVNDVDVTSKRGFNRHVKGLRRRNLAYCADRSNHCQAVARAPWPVD